MAYRVRDKYRAEPCALLDVAAGAHRVPDAGIKYVDSDPLVAAYPWYFVADGEEEAGVPTAVRIADVEAATAGPGERRTTRRA